MKVIFLLAVIMLIGFTPQNILGDYMPLNYPWDEKPKVCISMPPDEFMKIYTKRAMLKGITSWEDKLNWMSNSTNFDIKIYFPKSVEALHKCNVFVSYPAIILDDEGRSTDSLATTQCIKSTSNHTCFIKFNNSLNEDATQKEIINTMKHEFGHVLGLGHRQPLPDDSPIPALMAIVLDNDIMFWQLTPLQDISCVNLEALRTMYGNDGWEGENRGDFDYIIHRYNQD